MAGKGIYYESQFEEATIELLREAHWQYTFGDDIHRKYTDPLIGRKILQSGMSFRYAACRRL